jgi:hypothetical protein
MTYTGPQKYPGASLAYWYQGTWGGAEMETNVCTWHTTEGMTLPTYGGGASAPNLTAKPDFANKKLRWYQHFDIDRSARALVDNAGGVTTNRNNNVQVELVGTCDPATRNKWVNQGRRQNVDFIFWPEAPDWALREMALFVRWLYVNHGVPMRSTVTWRAYPGSYGVNASQRLTSTQFNAYSGHLGHQHVPEGNDHGDPGNIAMARVLVYAIGEEQDMALSDEDVTKVVKAVWGHQEEGPAGDGRQVRTGAVLGWLDHTTEITRERIAEVEAKVDALAVKIDEIKSPTLTAAQTKAIGAAVAEASAAAIAEATAQNLANRLES